jgi:predicted acylesterase/phospholipase RssA
MPNRLRSVLPWIWSSVLLVPVLAVVGAPTAHAGPVPLDARAASAALVGKGAEGAGAPGPAGSWGLVLSGGGARGLAHIGVLRALEERSLRPDIVVGTSMGSIVGSLYAGGRTSNEIADLLRNMDWPALLYPRTDAFAWRGRITPSPLVRLVVGKRGPQIPIAAVDDSYLNYQLANVLFESGAASGGNFDSLSIPFRAVATDLATGRVVVLSSGNLGKAVRASMAIPFWFPPVAYESGLVIDGAFSSNLPIAPAHAMGVERLIAVDVGKSFRALNQDATATEVFDQMVELLMRRVQSDRPRPTDLLIHLLLSGYEATSYASFAAEAGLARRPPEPTAMVTDFPPLAPQARWTGLQKQSVRSADDVLGALPAGRFRPDDLRPTFRRLYESGLFQSAWPGLEVRDDSTFLHFEVLEEPVRQLDLSAAYGNDEGGRLYGRLEGRKTMLPYFRRTELVGTYRPEKTEAHLGFERWSLGRGASGPFLRGEYQHTKTRIFEDGEVVDLPRTTRWGAYAGAQLRLPLDIAGQAALGWTAIREGDRQWDAPSFVVRLESRVAARRILEGEWCPGSRAFGRASALFEFSRPLGRFFLKPAVLGAFVSGDAPTDQLVGLGGPRNLSGLRYREWLGRQYGASRVLFVYSLGAAFSAYASGEVGVVGEAVSAREISSRFQPAGGLGVEVITPFGPLRAHWGIGPHDRSRLDLMFGDRF